MCLCVRLFCRDETQLATGKQKTKEAKESESRERAHAQLARFRFPSARPKVAGVRERAGSSVRHVASRTERVRRSLKSIKLVIRMINVRLIIVN